MASILDQIVAAKGPEVSRRKLSVPQTDLEEFAAAQPPPLNFSGALLGDRVRLVAEIKKASPSRGVLRPQFDPEHLARTYAENGAAAISVLTDARFKGSLEHLRMVKDAVLPQKLPVLRKDFIFDPYQVHESRAFGADALLLIVAILRPHELRKLLDLSLLLRMQCLVEVHDEAELEVALDAGAEIIGINNRDLRTFHSDLSVTERLAPKVPQGKVIVSESGIATPEDISLLKRWRVNAALVGEALVTSPNVAAKVRQLSGHGAPAAVSPADG